MKYFTLVIIACWLDWTNGQEYSWHEACSIDNKAYCFNGGECNFVPVLGVNFCQCTSEFIGPRCEYRYMSNILKEITNQNAPTGEYRDQANARLRHNKGRSPSKYHVSQRSIKRLESEYNDIQWLQTMLARQKVHQERQMNSAHHKFQSKESQQLSSRSNFAKYKSRINAVMNVNRSESDLLKLIMKYPARMRYLIRMWRRAHADSDLYLSELRMKG